MGALYRENSTGFLVEFATNPGAGYTAIGAMPTDTVDNRVAWHRTLDTYGQTSTWHPSLASAAEDPSPLALTISLSNNSHLVSADSSGNVTDGYLGANTAVTIYRGTMDVTISEGWAFSIAASNCTANVVGNLVTVTAMSANTAYVVISATRIGSPTLTSTFSLAKVLRGAAGANGTNGVNGNRGSVQIVVSGASWSDSAAWAGVVAQTGTNPVLADMVTISDSTFTQSKFYAGGGNGTSTYGTWTTATQYINGNLLITGTVGANQIAANSITTSKLTFTPVQSGGSAADINANSTTISGGKITTGSITTGQLNFSPVQAGGAASDINTYGTTIDGSKITTGTLNANKIVAGTITADRLVVNGVTATQLINNATSSSSIAGGSISCSNSVGAMTYNSFVYASISPPASGRQTGTTTQVSLIATGTIYSSTTANHGRTIQILKNGVAIPSNQGGNISMYINQASVSGTNGIPFAVIGVDYIGASESATYSVGVTCNSSGANGSTTCNFGIIALDTFK